LGVEGADDDRDEPEGDRHLFDVGEAHLLARLPREERRSRGRCRRWDSGAGAGVGRRGAAGAARTGLAAAASPTVPSVEESRVCNRRGVTSWRRPVSHRCIVGWRRVTACRLVDRLVHAQVGAVHHEPVPVTTLRNDVRQERQRHGTTRCSDATRHGALRSCA
jgi:hypothetical protein